MKASIYAVISCWSLESLYNKGGKRTCLTDFMFNTEACHISPNVFPHYLRNQRANIPTFYPRLYI